MVVILILILTTVDAFREPEDQVTASVYISMVHLYQKFGRPLLKGKIYCRFNPTCSEYSIFVVKEQGIINGLIMSYERIDSCR